VKERKKCGLNNAKYISSDIQNEIIDIFKYAIHEVIFNEVKEAKYLQGVFYKAHGFYFFI
jgi:hypothetical protein